MSLICWAQIAERMLDDYPSFNRKLLHNLQATDPHFTWMLLLIAGIYLYIALAPAPTDANDLC